MVLVADSADFIQLAGRFKHSAKPETPKVTTPKTSRKAQRQLLAALNASDLALRRDECGDWRINGSRGHVYTWGKSGGWVLYVGGRSAKFWNSAKRHLNFCQVTQDGDEDGCLRLGELPTQAQAAVIRKVLGIKARRTVSPETVERLRSLAGERLKPQERAERPGAAPTYLPASESENFA